MEIQLKQAFEKIYGLSPSRTFFCPGRVNLMGEHLDYNGGFVLPCAISLGTYLAISLREDHEIHFHSLNLEESKVWKIQDPIQKNGKEWFYYPLGIFKYIQEAGFQIKGMNLLYGGNIPISSGLSSSASIEVLTAFSMNETLSLNFTLLDMVYMAKKVENEFIGLQSGIMDQFSVSFGKENEAILLNCKNLDFKYVPIHLGEYSLVIIGTNKSRNLSDSKYNERVEECTIALQNLQVDLPIQFLGDLDLKTFLNFRHLIKNPIHAKRALHVVSENNRVHESVMALQKGDLKQFGEFMYASHESLKRDYEVSGLELDTLIDYCLKNPSVLGARMTGAGFGGCAIAMVKIDSFKSFQREIENYYLDKIGYLPSIYRSDIGKGVHEISYPGPINP